MEFGRETFRAVVSGGYFCKQERTARRDSSVYKLGSVVMGLERVRRASSANKLILYDSPA